MAVCKGGGRICPTLMAGESMVLVYEEIYEIIGSDKDKK